MDDIWAELAKAQSTNNIGYANYLEAVIKAGNDKYNMFGSGQDTSTVDSSSPAKNAAYDALPSLVKGLWSAGETTANVFSFLTDVPRVVTTVLGFAMVVIAIYLLGANQIIRIQKP